MADIPSRLIPSRLIPSADGTPIAVFSSGSGPAIVLVHGAASDHTTFRVVGPRFEQRFTVHAIDRRGRGASGDAPRWSIEREYEDVRAVVEAIAAESGAPVDVIGHSFGGRVGLGAALDPGHLRRLVVYEGAPPAAQRPYQAADLTARLRTVLADRGPEALLGAFLAEVIGMSAAELEAYRTNPVWPQRVAAAPTILRELDGDASPAASLEQLARVRLPVLQLLGSDSAPPFRAAAEALHARLAHGRLVLIDGARHAAHHSHADRFVAEVEDYLGS
jgi:pimeloyl-ACP methyl ester carboxylesterase